MPMVRDPHSGKRRQVKEKPPPKTSLPKSIEKVASVLAARNPWAYHPQGKNLPENILRDRLLKLFDSQLGEGVKIASPVGPRLRWNAVTRLYETSTSGVWWRFRILRPKPLGGNPSEPVVRKYHGTSVEALTQILIDGRLRPTGHYGLLGEGVYCGDKPKALSYVKPNGDFAGALLELECRFGRLGEGKSADCDTSYGMAGVTTTFGGTLQRDEWCVRDPTRVRVVSVSVGLF